jgi:PAS domain S-box-containing protein
MLTQQDPELYLKRALDALSGDAECHLLLSEIPVPIYTTDPDGAVTYWNRACVEFAGREPKLGRDRWCVTWRLYTTSGDRLPHDECPMAEAIETKLPIRDKIAIAERPDGTRAAFRPYPTPLINKDGTLKGAVNMLIDVTEEQSHILQEQADRCRRLALATYDRATSKVLGDMADGFARTADDLSQRR